MDPQLAAKLQAVRLVVLDVDGVLTDGRLWFGADGSEGKVFNAQDGMGLTILRQLGLHVAVISGRSAPVVTQRMAELQIEHVYLGAKQKRPAFSKLVALLGLSRSQALFIGDDVIDLPLIELAGVGVAVANARPQVKAAADWVTEASGGNGAVREVCDALIETNGHWPAVMDYFSQT